MRDWGSVFNHYKAKGCDPSDAAHRADQWEKRQDGARWSRCPSTHCERRQECSSPNECSAKHRPPPLPTTQQRGCRDERALHRVHHA